MQIVRTSIIVLLLMIMANQAIAGSVRIEPPSSLFSLSVRIKDSPQDGSDPLTPDKRGIYTFEFGPKLFERSPYIRRIFVLTWTPLSEHIPARGVQPFSLEIPVLLRSWRVDDEYTIRTDGFQGIGDRWLSKYELMTNPEEQWLRLIASLQISDHYSQRIRPTVPEAGRALNTAIDSLIPTSNDADS
ncbi:hypothetical protein [Rhizobium sp. RU36D]|uniref:hypothetical protein n=1 Tax=Rhizobium sp. RU36D TaxID=1907415 RepID=UPI0009D810A0|nr:hypothetical protein [Rhizobium sp. RU36D]SMC68785.1 hypothetical protein SAMN05880593_104307 [Rhizobium sp. RU36D]